MRKLFQQRYATTHLVLVSPTVVPAEASAAAVIQSTKRHCWAEVLLLSFPESV